MSLWSTLVAPFSEYAFMRSALVACMALAVASGPLGTLLLLRRMGLVGDVLSHAVMPGAAIGFAFAGSALAVLSTGGLLTGIAVVLLMILGTRFGAQREDASLAAFYFASIGVGVLIVSLRGTNLDLMHVLLGTVLAIDVPALVLIVAIASVVVAVLALIFRPLAIQSFDPAFLRTMGGSDTALSRRIPGARRAGSRGRIPGVRHAARRRAAAPAGGGGALLGAAHWPAGRPQHWLWHGGRLCRIARVLPSQRAVGAGDRLCRGTHLRRFGSRSGKPHAGDGTQRSQADLRGK